MNLSLTFLLYAVCCAILGGLLALDNITVALILGVGLAWLFWVSMLRYLIRGVIAARRGEKNEIPGWVCAGIVADLLGQLAGHGVGQQAAPAGEHDRAASKGIGAGRPSATTDSAFLRPAGPRTASGHPSARRIRSMTRSSCRSDSVRTSRAWPGLFPAVIRAPYAAGCLTFHHRVPPTWLCAPGPIPHQSPSVQ